ncbi:MAG: hypothetical protein KF819_13545 [Labilithrix sp.]|nr:hypothetical protein [Labilithrix sp.]
MRRAAAILTGGLVLAGCRSCDERTVARTDASAQPSMPTGLLLPPPSAPSGDGGADLRIARDAKGGPYAELQVAAEGDRPDKKGLERWKSDSRFVPLDAMTILHEAFARALPGFDLFLPRLFSPEALARLSSELVAFETEWSSVSDVSLAKKRWSSSSQVRDLRDDGEWLATRAMLAQTAREIADLARDLSAKGKSLWVIGM